ncbi:MAG: hypothetical protein V1721_08660 [Pseudomonadota bacterium]
MTDAENYVFDFEKEVEQYFIDFPQLRATTVFVDTSGNRRKACFDIEEAAARCPAFAEILKEIKYRIQDRAGSISYDGQEPEFRGEYNGVLLDSRNDPILIYPPDVNRAYVLDHEAGHILTKWTKSNIYHGNAADAFAAICHLRRFGNDPQALSLLSCFRSYEMISYGETSHLTTSAVNQIIRDSQFKDFKSMSPEETIEAAKNYAVTCTPSALEAQAALEFSFEIKHASKSKGSVKSHVELLASTALSSSSPFIFETFGVSIIKPFLLISDGATLRGEHIAFDRETREKFCDKFIERAHQLGLHEIAAELGKIRADALTPAPEADSKACPASEPFAKPPYQNRPVSVRPSPASR